MDELMASKQISLAGMRAQATRLRVVSENIANADSVSKYPGGKPYQRKVVTFKNELDRQTGVRTVKVNQIKNDDSEFQMKYDPSSPAAGANGYVLLPNVNPLVEMMDLREAQRSYDANLKAVSIAKDMTSRTIDMLR
ncbi:MAG: flagellar basal body rod protein FlgC [Alphaproteobacteria bacterium]|nr:flagellar basal body rod protein FlgC [Alphaproteobacteria bacterium]